MPSVFLMDSNRRKLKKDLNLDEPPVKWDAEPAAKMAGHIYTVITLKHYLVNEEKGNWRS